MATYTKTFTGVANGTIWKNCPSIAGNSVAILIGSWSIGAEEYPTKVEITSSTFILARDQNGTGTYEMILCNSSGGNAYTIKSGTAALGGGANTTTGGTNPGTSSANVSLTNLKGATLQVRVKSTSGAYLYYKNSFTVKVTTSIKTYSITYSVSPSGSGSCTGAASAKKGDTVSITRSPNSGYLLNYVTVNGTSIGSATSFTMPAQNTAVIAYYKTVTKCGAPTSVSVSQSGGTVTVSWSGATAGTNNSISSYGVIRNTSASTSGATTINSAATGSSLTNKPGAGTFYYGVRTQGSAGSSYYSGYKWSSAIDTRTKCGAPTSVTVSQSGGTVTISWSGATAGTNNSISSYGVIRNTSASTSGATTVNGSASSSPITNKPGAGTFYYGVRTQGSAGSSYYSGYKWSSAIDTRTKCGAPTSVSVSQSNGTVTISWSGATAGTNNTISNYGIIRNTSASTTGATTVNSSASASPITDTPGAGIFYYGVRTQGSAGSSYYSSYKWSSAIDTRTACTAPTSVTCSRIKNQVTISWSGASGGANNAISNYTILRNSSASDSGAVTVANNAASSPYTDVTALSAGTYYYGVRTEGVAGSSYYSGYQWSSAVTIPIAPFVTVGSLLTKVAMDTLKTWLNTSNINTIIANSKITATDGQTYDSNVTTGIKLNASWYNEL